MHNVIPNIKRLVKVIGIRYTICDYKRKMWKTKYSVRTHAIYFKSTQREVRLEYGQK